MKIGRVRSTMAYNTSYINWARGHRWSVWFGEGGPGFEYRKAEAGFISGVRRFHGRIHANGGWWMPKMVLAERVVVKSSTWSFLYVNEEEVE